MLSNHPLWILVGIGIVHLLGAASAVHAVMRARSAEGTVAWVMGFLTLPYLTLPFYWVFARYRFQGYVDARRSIGEAFRPAVETLQRCATPFVHSFAGSRRTGLEAVVRLAHMPFTRGNALRLLVDGGATFDAIANGIMSANEYVLFQFFIVRDDDLGRRLKELLIARLRAGVNVFFLYDAIGSRGLPEDFSEELRSAGAKVRAFGQGHGLVNRLQLNFRNHRKIVVVDGRTAWVGGLNVGDEYVGKSPRFGRWRDTHLQLRGPAVHALQLVFLEDWHWAAGAVPELDWSPRAALDDDIKALVLPTGPADELETCGLAFLEAIHSARKRIWIASPYFVPDGSIVAALQLAVLRGVDVRILLPEKPDHLLVWLAGFAFYESMLPHGVRIFRYRGGFLHQKVMLVDDDCSWVGTANLDNRSFRLNFEVMVCCIDRGFAARVERMLLQDLSQSVEAHIDDLKRRSLAFRLGTRVAQLMAPLL